MFSVDESDGTSQTILKCYGMVHKYSRLFRQGQIKANFEGSNGEQKIDVRRVNIATRPPRLVKGQRVSFELKLPLAEKLEALNVCVLYGEGVPNFADTTESMDPEFEAVLLHSNESLLLSDVIQRDRSNLAQQDRQQGEISAISSADSLLSTATHLSIEEATIHADSTVRFVSEGNDEMDIARIERL